MKSISWSSVKQARCLVLLVVFGSFLVGVIGCGRVDDEGGQAVDVSDRQIKVVTTTNIIGDLLHTIGGDRIDLTVLMGPGVDPHLYKASEGDVQRMAQADVIFYNGLHLEGKMTEVFEQMKRRNIQTVAVAEEAVPPEKRVESAEYAGNYDPHVWFDVELWIEAARAVASHLAEMDPTHADYYRLNAEEYIEQLRELDKYVEERVSRIPSPRRVLITSHDAFSYFGRGYGFEVRGLQGISTAAEAGTADVQRLAEYVARNRIPALFVESSVPPRGIQAVREAVQARGFTVEVGGTLYGDALGDQGTSEGTYIGAVRHNIDAIVSGLTREVEHADAAE